MADEEGRSSEGQALNEEIAECCGCTRRRSSSGEGKSHQTAKGAYCIQALQEREARYIARHPYRFKLVSKEPIGAMCKSPLPRPLRLQRSVVLGQRLTQLEGARRISSYPRRSCPPAWRRQCPSFLRPLFMER